MDHTLARTVWQSVGPGVSASCLRLGLTFAGMPSRSAVSLVISLWMMNAQRYRSPSLFAYCVASCSKNCVARNVGLSAGTCGPVKCCLPYPAWRQRRAWSCVSFCLTPSGPTWTPSVMAVSSLSVVAPGYHLHRRILRRCLVPWERV